MRTYSRRSNLWPFMRSGFCMYIWTCVYNLKNYSKMFLLTIYSSPFLTVAITWSPNITRIPLPLLLKSKYRKCDPPWIDLFGGLTIHRLLLAFSSQDFRAEASCGSSKAEGITEPKVLVVAVVFLTFQHVASFTNLPCINCIFLMLAHRRSFLETKEEVRRRTRKMRRRTRTRTRTGRKTWRIMSVFS